MWDNYFWAAKQALVTDRHTCMVELLLVERSTCGNVVICNVVICRNFPQRVRCSHPITIRHRPLRHRKRRRPFLITWHGTNRWRHRLLRQSTAAAAAAFLTHKRTWFIHCMCDISCSSNTDLMLIIQRQTSLSMASFSTCFLLLLL